MDLVNLTYFLIEKLVDNKDSVSVSQIENNGETIIQILVNNDNMGANIGKNGNIANAIRTIIQATSYANNLGKIRINIDAKE